MSQKIVIVMVHGMGRQKHDFAQRLQQLLSKKLRQKLKRLGLKSSKSSEFPFVFSTLHWAPITDRTQNKMMAQIQIDEMPWPRTRQFIFGYLGDAIAYQMPSIRNEFMYDMIHRTFKERLASLCEVVGDKAPLCLISHSMGSVISGEFLRLQQLRASQSSKPLESGHTLMLYYTLGSPIPIWALREKDFGTPPTIPSPELARYYPNAQGEWLNFYCPSDVLGYPLKKINDRYDTMVTRDISVSTGGLIARYTPLSHLFYWTNTTVIDTIAGSLVKSWRHINGK